MKQLACIALLGLLVACQSNVSRPPQSGPVTGAANAGQQPFTDADAGISFTYPSNWKPATGSKSQLEAIAPSGGKLTLNVPKLPFHIPGMIPIGQVESGYVDDVKKRLTNAAVTDLPDPTLPDAKQARVKIAGQENGKPSVDEAVLIVHQDQVYILSIDADTQAYPQMHSALDDVLKSLHWTK